MRLGRSISISVLTLVATAAFPGGCGNDGIVGGTCAKGYTDCSNHCVNLTNDRLNCGRCGHQCPTGVACIHGLCGGGGEGGWGGDNPQAGSANHGRDGGNGLAGTDNDASSAGAFGEFDVTYPDDGAGGGGNRGGSGNLGGNGTGTSSDSGDGCVPPYDTAAHCGSCNRVCVEPTRVCAPVNGKFDCVPFCNAPLVECNGGCVDLQSDSDNCGQCGRACRSAICQGGKCIDAQAGFNVAICMNYREINQAWTTNYLLGNAIYLSHVNPVKILAYDEFADPNVRARVDTAIGWASAKDGWGYRITSVNTPDGVNTQLKKPDYDVFLIYEQSNAPKGTLATYGSQWAKAIESFSYVGGVTIVLSGATGTKEMSQLLTSSRILEVTSESAFNQQTAYTNPYGIGAGLALTFRTPNDSCLFTTPVVPDNKSTFFVVTDYATGGATARPLAVQRVAHAPVQ